MYPMLFNKKEGLQKDKKRQNPGDTEIEKGESYRLTYKT